MELNEPAISYSKRKYSIAEYLELENESDKNMNTTKVSYSQCRELSEHKTITITLRKDVDGQ